MSKPNTLKTEVKKGVGTLSNPLPAGQRNEMGSPIMREHKQSLQLGRSGAKVVDNELTGREQKQGRHNRQRIRESRSPASNFFDWSEFFEPQVDYQFILEKVGEFFHRKVKRIKFNSEENKMEIYFDG